ncbi:hypothetical protein B0H34DRAFT_292139 [Crassisporium funariophilum]|nr:hypothetical protein B0H34DRAFT_292139 [Crassisporium funariophilum]
MDHDNHSYLAITLSPQSPFFFNPSTITAIHPSLTYRGPVGQLNDVHLYSIRKDEGMHARDDAVDALKAGDGVLHVEIQVPQTRVKRGGDEL